MKRVIIGDIHGRTTWEKIVETEKDASHIIFLGDYVDSFDVDPLTQLKNLRKIIVFKVEHPSLVTLLIGNHDFHYMSNYLFDERYSGYQPRMFPSFNMEFREYANQFQMAFLDEHNVIYSHAGVTETWLQGVQITSSDPKVIVDSINELFKHKPNLFGFNQMDRSGSGNSPLQSPIWVRPESLYKDKIPNFMVIGHTESGQPVHLEKSIRQGFINIDCLENGFYLVQQDGNFEIKRL